MAKPIIKVLVVDDHPIVRRGLSAEINLDPGMQVVGEARDGEEAVHLAHILQPDVILMDIVMPHKDGIAAIAEIIQENPKASILVLTSFIEDEKILAAVKAGALGYIYKDESPDQVLQAIRDIAKGKPRLDPSLVLRMVREMRGQEPENPATHLTERETEILRMVAKGAPYKEIAGKIGVRETTVRAHVSNILSKLGLNNRSQLVLYAVQKGLIASRGNEER